MSDQCANCDVRGHFDKCEGVECGHHENWYPNELKKQLVAAEQRIDELLSANGSLQYKNDRLTAKTQRLEVAEKMAREARAQLAAAEQRAETLKDERDMYDARATEYWEDVLELSDKLEDAEQRAEKAEKDVISAQAEFVEILHNRQAKIEALKTAERNAVRECERIASRHIANAQHVAYQIRNRYPQHFEEE